MSKDGSMDSNDKDGRDDQRITNFAAHIRVGGGIEVQTSSGVVRITILRIRGKRVVKVLVQTEHRNEIWRFPPPTHEAA